MIGTLYLSDMLEILFSLGDSSPDYFCIFYAQNITLTSFLVEQNVFLYRIFGFLPHFERKLYPSLRLLSVRTCTWSCFLHASSLSGRSLPSVSPSHDFQMLCPLLSFSQASSPPWCHAWSLLSREQSSICSSVIIMWVKRSLWLSY